MDSASSAPPAPAKRAPTGPNPNEMTAMTIRARVAFQVTPATRRRTVGITDKADENRLIAPKTIRPATRDQASPKKAVPIALGRQLSNTETAPMTPNINRDINR